MEGAGSIFKMSHSISVRTCNTIDLFHIMINEEVIENHYLEIIMRRSKTFFGGGSGVYSSLPGGSETYISLVFYCLNSKKF